MRGAFHAEHFQNVRVRVTATDQDEICDSRGWFFHVVVGNKRILSTKS
jgi:hypothetical protein